MAILFSQADGSDQHYDTYEEFEQAFILLKRLNGEKVPQDLLDEVKEKFGGKEGVEGSTYTINVDTSLLTEKLDEEIAKLKRAEPLGKDANGEDLFEGDFVTGTEDSHYSITNHNAICEVQSDSVVKLVKSTDEAYVRFEGESFRNMDLRDYVKLSDNMDEAKAKYGVKEPKPFQVQIDGRNFESAIREATRELAEALDEIAEDRTPVSDECENVEEDTKIEVGDIVRVVSTYDGTSDPYHEFNIGSNLEVKEVYGNGKIEAYDGIFYQTLLPHHFEKEVDKEGTSKLSERFVEEIAKLKRAEPLGKDANGDYLFEGDFVTGSEDSQYSITNYNAICEVQSDSVVKLVKSTDEVYEYRYEGELFAYIGLEDFVKLSDNLDEAKEKFDELNGVKDSPTEFRTGDIVKVTEPFRDYFGDWVASGAVYEYDENLEEGKPFVGSVYLGDNHDKLRLVCRKEDRKDIEL